MTLREWLSCNDCHALHDADGCWVYSVLPGLWGLVDYKVSSAIGLGVRLVPVVRTK